VPEEAVASQAVPEEAVASQAVAVAVVAVVAEERDESALAWLGMLACFY
jgi:hypothetical protein